MPIPKKPVVVQSVKAAFPSSGPIAADARTGTMPGAGYLSGSAPSGLATLDGNPIICQIRVHYRPKQGAVGYGALVAVTQSNAAGEWMVSGLDPKKRFDVIASLAGSRDVIYSDVAPYVPAATQTVQPLAHMATQYDWARFGHCAVG
jgi:hypothetical protein